MNKADNFKQNRIVIVVGHPASGIEDVHIQLQNLGIDLPESSSRHGMPAVDISSYLIKRASREFDFIEPIVQVKPAAIWQSLALDLLLANGEKNIWGWSDPQAIHMLDYWLEVDPDFCFVLVYDGLARALTREFSREYLSIDKITEFFTGWSNYNAALLNFYSRHPERCLLVHSEAALSDPELFVDALHLRLKINVSVSDTLFQARKLDAQLVRTAEAIVQDAHGNDFYEDLQSLADLPQDVDGSILAVTSWNDYVKVCRKLDDVLEKNNYLINLQKANEDVTQGLLRNYKNDNELLLLSLHKLQDECQRKYINFRDNNEVLQSEAKALESHLVDSKKMLEERDKRINNLEKKIVVVERYKKIEEVNKHLLLTVHQLQEKFEIYHVENKQLKQKILTAELANEKKTALDNANKLKQYGAVDRVKKQLSYRIGNVVIKKYNSLMGIITLPHAIWQEVREFNKEKKIKNGVKLLPIERYADAHEAAKIRQHLSYRLGKVMLENYKTPVGWIKMPFVMNKEVKNFRSWRSQSRGLSS